MVVLFLKFLPSSAAQAKDTDGDGFSDEVDGCVSEPSSSNNGCPDKKEKTINGSEDDHDGDGLLRVEFRDGKETDVDDNDACKPNKNCKNCDEDHDGLNLEREKTKGTNKTKADTDGDGVIDGKDTAPLKFGKSATGEVLILDAGLDCDGKTVWYNTEIFNYYKSVKLKITHIDKGISELLPLETNGRITVNIDKLFDADAIDYYSIELLLGQIKGISLKNTKRSAVQFRGR